MKCIKTEENMTKRVNWVVRLVRFALNRLYLYSGHQTQKLVKPNKKWLRHGRKPMKTE